MFKFHYEVWKPVVGFEKKYVVSNYCKVKSLNYNRTGIEKLLKPGYNRNGYEYVSLWKNGKIHSFLTHRIGMIAFVPNIEQYKEINHKDANRKNNYICVKPDGTIDLEKSNLEWCDRHYNLEYSQVNQNNGKKRSKKIKQILNGKTIKIWNSINEAARELGFDCGSIVKCCKKYNSYKTCGGYEWKYC